MIDLPNLAITNALLIIPLAVIVTVVGRWLRRPAVIHALWVIVLLKLLTPQLYEVSIPALDGLFHQFTPKLAESTPFVEANPLGNKVAASGQSTSTVLTSEASLPFTHWKQLSYDVSLTDDSELSAASSHSVTEAPASVSLRNTSLFVWVVGSLAFFCTLCFRARRFHQFVRRAPIADQPTQELVRSIATRYDLRLLPTIRVASGEFPPLLWVLPGSASIVLPRQLLSQLDSTSTKNLLAHELAHFARGDHWVRLLESVALGIYWWHPLAWFARRQLQHAEEQCCDAWVLWAFPKTQTEYARTLLATLDYLSSARSALPPLASGMGRANLIRRRFEMILHHRSPRKLSTFGLAITSAVAMTILPWSTSVFAQTQDSSEVTTLTETDHAAAEAKGKSKASSWKHKVKTDKIKDSLRTNAMKIAKSKEVQSLIQSAIRHAMQEAEVGLKQAKVHVAEETFKELTNSLEGVSVPWPQNVARSLEALEGIPEEEIEVITQHIESAMKHVGIAIEKSAEAFGKAMEQELAPESDRKKTVKQRPIRVSSAIKAAKSVPMKDLQKVLSAMGKALENVDAEIEVHVADDQPDSEKLPKVRRAKTIRKQKTQRSDKDVEEILLQIKALMKQLETDVETNATSTRR